MSKQNRSPAEVMQGIVDDLGWYASEETGVRPVASDYVSFLARVAEQTGLSKDVAGLQMAAEAVGWRPAISHGATAINSIMYPGKQFKTATRKEKASARLAALLAKIE